MVDSRSQLPAQILGGLAGEEGRYLTQIYDAATSTYLAVAPEPATQKLHAAGLTGAGTSCAMIDTGLLQTHPTIRRVLKSNGDFTGEGPNDLNGHGTVCALILLSTAPDTNLINAKTLKADGYGSVRSLSDGIKWASQQDVDAMNISAGVYTPGCKGDCLVCSTAREAAMTGILISAAAGNKKGTTACPANLSRFAPDTILSVMAYDLDNHLTMYSGQGNIGQVVGGYSLIRV